MRFDSLFRVLFIIYCVEAGIFLVLTPWTPAWDRGLLQIPFPWWRGVGLATSVRGAVSGFGLVHLVWGLHDIDYWWHGRRAVDKLGVPSS